MKIYLIESHHEYHDYDCYSGFVIVANSPATVRNIAATTLGDEDKNVWLDTNKSDITELGEANKKIEQRIILSSFNAG